MWTGVRDVDEAIWSDFCLSIIRKMGVHRDTGAPVKDWEFAEGAATSGKGWWDWDSYHELQGHAAEQPQMLVEQSQPFRRWWYFRDRIYTEDDGLDASQVLALLTEREIKLAQRVDRAKRRTKSSSLPSSEGTPSRMAIPRDVKLFVWQRDEGRCVECGSNENLEFDHIIPVTMGGANTARNLQLLCEPCNRSKGGHL